MNTNQFMREDGQMSDDDLEPIFTVEDQKNLEVLSIEALHQYIAELEAEIDRVRDAISGKHNARASADTFFKS
jgi:uncharacterized small protein (DUF1192 family)